jgi:hypothetical protein
VTTGTESGTESGVESGVDGPTAVEGDAGSGGWYRESVHDRGDAVPGWQLPLAVAAAALTGSAVAVVLTRRLAGNPFADGATQPWYLAAAVLGLVGVAVLLWAPAAARRWVAPAGVVAVATWTSGYITAQLAGTPFTYWGVHGDTGRLSALVTRYTVEWTSADVFIDGKPSEYPPLFPWIVGRAAVLLDVPAWRLLAPAATLCIALSFVAGWLLWRRLIGDLAALAVTTVAIAAAGADPRKCFEVLALVVLLPWLISTFMRLAPRDGGLSWLPAGVVGGLMLSLYQAYLLFTALAMLALILLNLRQVPRLPYLRHLVLVAVTSFVVASWYLVPWLWALATQADSQVSDEFLAADVVRNKYYLPWREDGLTVALLIVGLASAIWFARRTVWAPVLLAVLVSSYVFRLGAAVRFNETGHTLFLHYTQYTITAAAGAATVLGARELWLRGDRALRLSVPAAAVAVAAVLGVQVIHAEFEELAAPHTLGGQAAHGELLPDLEPTRYADEVEPMPAFPSEQARREIDRAYGAYALPVVLSASERLFAYYPMHAYMSRDRTATSSLQTWDDRNAELLRIAAIEDPAEFVAAVDDNRFGNIDVFILRGEKNLRWGDVDFRREQFDPRWFTEVSLRAGFTMYLRNGADVENQRYPR